MYNNNCTKISSSVYENAWTAQQWAAKVVYDHFGILPKWARLVDDVTCIAGNEVWTF